MKAQWKGEDVSDSDITEEHMNGLPGILRNT